jgi:hypothetical protein
LQGKRGQALLRDLVQALDLMPVRELGMSHLAVGNACALGAVARLRHVPESEIQRLDKLLGKDPDDAWDNWESVRNTVSDLLNIAPALASEIMYENDECAPMDDAKRWAHMRAWAILNGDGENT